MKATAVFLLTTALTLCGCGNGGSEKPAIANPALVGKWIRPVELDDGNGGTLYEDETIELAADGTTTTTDIGRVNCNGSQVYAGGSWSDSTTMLTFAGKASCSGTLTCTITGLPVSTSCDGTTLDWSSSSSYALSANGNTLTLTSSNDGGVTTETYTRH
jgi:hypothetical protein